MEIPSWDLFFKSKGVPLPPPPPPRDPFDPREIRFRKDREVSMDGRIQEVKRIPQWVDVIDRNEITEWRPLGFGELMRRLPNVAMADGGSPFLALPIIRGLGGDRVKLLTDGVWTESQALGVAGGTVTLWDPESIERVEVYHGPGAFLRGANASGGVINFVPLRPHRHECLRDVWGESASSYQSSTNTFRQRLSGEGGSGRVAALLGATYEDHGDRQTADGALDPSTYDSYAFDAAIDYFLDNTSTLGFTGQYVKAQNIRSPIGGGDAFTQPEYSRLFLGLTLSSVQMGPVFHGARMSLSFDSFLQDDDQASALSLTSGVSSSDKVKRFDYRVSGNLYLWDCHDTWAEVAVAYAHLERTESILCLPVSAPGRLTWIRGITIIPTAEPGTCVDGFAKYTADELNINALLEDETHSGCWDFMVGGRLDWNHLSDDRTGESSDAFLFGVAGGVTRHLTDCVTVYGNLSYGQRRASIQEQLSVTILNGITVYGNPDLKDEQSANGEIGMKATWDSRATLQVAGFGHWLGDYIGRRPIGADEFWDNLGNVFLSGAEITGAYRPCPSRCEGLELFGSLGGTWSSDEDIVNDVPLAGRLGARLSTCVGCPGACGMRRWFVEAAVRGGTHDGFNADGDGYATAEVLGGVGVSRGGRRAIWATLGVTNLFNAEYTEPFSRLPVAGIGVITSLVFDF